MNEPQQGDDWEAVCDVDHLRKGDLIEHLSGTTLLVLAWIDGEPWAGSGLCPHQFARLSEGRIKDGRLHCARHQASFCLRTGTPDNRWQITGIRLYQTRVRNGLVEVDSGNQA